MAEALKRPGGELASRPLHFFWVVDCSGSMYGEKIGTVNHAIQSTIPEMVDAAKDNPNAQLLVRTLKFSTGATWVTPDPVNIEDFAWDDLDAGGVTDLGKAFEMLAAQLTIPPMTDRALPPVIVLLSDGQPTDDYKKSLDICAGMEGEINYAETSQARKAARFLRASLSAAGNGRFGGRQRRCGVRRGKHLDHRVHTDQNSCG